MNDLSLFPHSHITDRGRNISGVDLTCVWANDAHEAVLAAEKAEADLSYSSDCKSEKLRKLVGAYYTPADVAGHFWMIFFERRKVVTPRDAQRFLDNCLFIEPSVGAGALFFSLLEGFVLRGLSPAHLSSIKADLIDINDQALEFVRFQIERLEYIWGVKFSGIRLLNGNFLHYDLRKHAGTPVFFGNPPFAANERGSSKWKNIYADFLEFSLNLPQDSSHLHYILPLSITFSRDYRDLRKKLKESHCEISISSYDNVPDTLFKSGKPKHSNTNKANSQRCSILTAIPSDASRIFSSRLHRWSKADRANLLSSTPTFRDVSQYEFDDQIPRPSGSLITDYLQSSSEAKRLASLIDGSERYRLFVASVARNYISFRDAADNSCNVLGFENEEDFLTALGIISSRLFFEYWLSVGDGFHVTKLNIWSFPIGNTVEEKVREHHYEIRRYWKNRTRFEKNKLNSGKQIRSFDFSEVAPKLL